MLRKGIVSTVLCGVAATLLMPGTASAQQDRVSATEKGSLLIFSKVEIRWDVAGNLTADTFINITNDYPEDVLVQMYFINGDGPLDADPTAIPPERAHPGWNWVDNEITLTANEPTSWSAFTGQPKGVSPFAAALDPGFPPGRPAPEPGATDRVMRGYIIAWAVNSDGEEIRHNHLAGNGTIVTYLGAAAWQYNAWAFQAVGSAQGLPTGTPGVLGLDGVEYSQPFDQLLLMFNAVGSSRLSGGARQVLTDCDVTLHAVSADLRQETDGPVTTKAHYDVWNENEVKFSGAYRCITCWDQTNLSEYGIPNHFFQLTLQTPVGKARIDGLQSALCDLDFDVTDGLPLGDDPRDVVSEDAALLGLKTTLMFFDGFAGFAMAGTNMVGMGVEDAEIQYDTLGPPPELPKPKTRTITGGRVLLRR